MELHHHSHLSPITTNNSTIILQLHLISAQGLHSSSCRYSSNLNAYIVAYVDPTNKLKSKISVLDDNDHPLWNDSFILAVDDDLASKRPNACLVLEVYKCRLFRKDKKIGVAHILVESLIPGEDVDGLLMGFGIRRNSDRTAYGQAIINIGVKRFDRLSNSLSLFSHGSDSSMSEKVVPKNSSKNLWRWAFKKARTCKGEH